MLCEPAKWGDKIYGGFLENDIKKKKKFILNHPLINIKLKIKSYYTNL